MGKSRLLLSLLVSLTLSSGMTAFAKSHHKKSDESSTAGTVQSDTVKEHHKHKSRKKEVAALPDERSDKRESETKQRREEKRDAALDRSERTETRERHKRNETAENGEHKRGGLLDFLHPNRTQEGGTASDEAAPNPLDSAAHPGEVYVHGYTRKDGTVVHGYWRHKPHTK